MPGDPFTRSCVVAGCRQPVTAGGRCAQHARAVDQARGLGTDRFHRDLYASAEWHALRRRVLRGHPLCQCGCGRLSTTVHHVRPHHGSAALFFDPRNLRALAAGCHTALHSRERGRPIKSRPESSKPKPGGRAVRVAAGPLEAAGGASDGERRA